MEKDKDVLDEIIEQQRQANEKLREELGDDYMDIIFQRLSEELEDSYK